MAGAAARNGAEVTSRNNFAKVMLALAAAVFLTAAISKLFSFYELTSVITKSRLFPVGVQVQVAGCVIAAEFLIGVALILPKTRQVGLAAAFAASSMYFGYAVWQWQQNIDAPCHCFGILFTMSPPVSASLNIVLSAILRFLMVHRVADVTSHSNTTVATRLGETS